ncbi:hypothetical protein BSKO_09790 [Bryopsis sp. KO-2023]|nr:hypothetical protein BSKO_09790 [Bryopsis sp. KO-2023]
MISIMEGEAAPPLETRTSSNPFVITGDQELFRRTEAERLRKAEERDEVKCTSVVEKTTFSSRMHATFSGDMASTFRQRGETDDPASRQLDLQCLYYREVTLAASAVPSNDHRRREKENMADFIAKKREIFLVQMSLDTKRAEICKLEERALQREEALKRSEQMLEEDALKFDAFLKENDEKVQEAIKKAEVEAKAKQDKVMEIKRLNASIAALRSELNKYEEQLEDFKKYKDFLDSITPNEWFVRQQRRREQRREDRFDHWRAQCERIKLQKSDAAAAKVQAENDYANARTQQEAEQAEKAIKDAVMHLKVVRTLKEPPPPADDDEEEEEEMYFKDPGQILELYAHLEEQNLFLIQNVQETEEALEELKTKYRDTKGRLDGEIETLKAQIHTLELAIAVEQQKQRILKERTIQNVGSLNLSKGNGPAVTLDELNHKVAEMYERCGFDVDASIGTLTMLTNMETKLEEYLSIIDTMSIEYVETAEKAREKDRRQQAREEKIELQQREHEARVKRALERAAAPVFKKIGKPVMFRSRPVKKKVVVKEENRNDDDAELDAFLATEML